MLGCNNKGGVSSTNLLGGGGGAGVGSQQVSSTPQQSEALEMTPHGIGNQQSQPHPDGSSQQTRPAQLDVSTLQRGIQRQSTKPCLYHIPVENAVHSLQIFQGKYFLALNNVTLPLRQV